MELIHIWFEGHDEKDTSTSFTEIFCKMQILLINLRWKFLLEITLLKVNINIYRKEKNEIFF